MGRRARWVLAGLAGLLLLACTGVWAAVDFRPHGNRFDSNGVWLHYQDRGSGTPVILLHGFGLNARTGWELRGVPRTLLDDFRVIALDQRGHGRSGKPHDPAAYGEEMAHDVARLMDHLRLEKAHVVGFSMGAFVTLKFASLYPERLITAAVCGAGYEAVDGENLGALKAMQAAVLERRDFRPLAKFLEPGRQDPPRWKAAGMNLYLRAANDELALAAVLGGFPRLAAPPDAVRAIDIPMISIIGSDDPFLPGVEVLHALAPNHELIVVPGKNHMNTMISRAFKQGLLDFLRRHTPGKE
jgi:pimeloyl-ACP methyl ester carboxylesterase